MHSMVKQIFTVAGLVGCLLLQTAQATLYVSNYSNGTVYSAPNGGGLLTPLIPAGTNGLTRSVGMMLHPQSGLLMVANQMPTAAGGSVKLFDPTTGAAMGSFGGAMNFPSAIVLGQNNDILVTGFFGTQGIYRFDYNGNPLAQVTGGGLNSVSNAVFGPDNKLYVANYGGGNILRFVWDAAANAGAGNYVPDTTLMGGVFAEGGDPNDPNEPNNLQNPGGLAFNDGKLYVTNLLGQNVLSYDAMTGAFAGQFISNTQLQAGFPAQISFLDDTAFIAQTNYDLGVGAFSSAGAPLGTYAAPVPGGNAISGAFLFTNPVPEPGTWAAIVLAGGGWCLYLRRKTRAE